MAGGTTRQIGAPGSPGVADGLDDRTRRILASIVRDHIQGGEPVGSHAIARRPEVDCSSATVRAVMADLEALGYLEKPHTSAGRVPTVRGYRYYVDVLLHLTPPLAAEREMIERRAHDAASQVDGLMAEASRILHRLTRHAGVVASPRPQGERLRRIEFLKLREGRILAVLVSAAGRVQNRLLAMPTPPPSESELVEAQNYLNSRRRARASPRSAKRSAASCPACATGRSSSASPRCSSNNPRYTSTGRRASWKSRR